MAAPTASTGVSTLQYLVPLHAMPMQTEDTDGASPELLAPITTGHLANALAAVSDSRSASSAATQEAAPRRMCATPGCALSDFHGGPCSIHERSGRRTVAAASSSPKPCTSVDRAIAKIHSGVVALGKWEKYFPVAGEGRTWSPMPRTSRMDLQQWRRLLDEAMRPGACAIVLISGTEIPCALHTPILHLVAERLPGSSLVALNLGEFTDADDNAYEALADAIAKPSCVLGHLYFKEPVSQAEVQRKCRVRAQLVLNCFKQGYLQQLSRDEVWSLGGAHCWHNFSEVLRRRALAAANDAILFGEPHRRWAKGTISFSIEANAARKTLEYVLEASNYDSEGFLLIGPHKIGGFSNEPRTHSNRFDQVLQWRNSRHFPNKVLQATYNKIPSFRQIVVAALAQLPEKRHGGRQLIPLHVNMLNQSSTLARLGNHNDLDEELQAVDEIRGKVARVCKVVYTAIISLAGGETSLRILGKYGGEIDFGIQPGAGLIFRSALTHSTGKSGKGIWKMTIFFGYFLDK